MHPFQRLGRALALVGLGAAVALSGGPARAQDAARVYEVTISNLAEGQLLSPRVLATHGHDYTLFEVGERASEGVWTVAEQGNPTTLAEQLRSTPEIDAMVVADGPVHRVNGPGPSTMTLRIESHGADRLSLAMMVGCTNDGFTGLSAVPLSRSMVPATYYAPAYDAGTETNTQRWADLPDGCNALGPAPLAADGMNARVLTDAPIQMHPGIEPGRGDLTEAFAWSDPVVKITVQRVE
jgi:hypothetical protein